MSKIKSDISRILIDQQFIQYEEEVIRNPYYLKAWLKYIEISRDKIPVPKQYILFERALQYLPRSYKLWIKYFQLRELRLTDAPINDSRFKQLIDTYEKSLVHMHKMPVIWYKITLNIRPNNKIFHKENVLLFNGSAKVRYELPPCFRPGTAGSPHHATRRRVAPLHRLGYRSGRPRDYLARVSAVSNVRPHAERGHGPVPCRQRAVYRSLQATLHLRQR